MKIEISKTGIKIFDENGLQQANHIPKRDEAIIIATEKGEETFENMESFAAAEMTKYEGD